MKIKLHLFVLEKNLSNVEEGAKHSMFMLISFVLKPQTLQIKVFPSANSSEQPLKVY